MAISDAVSAGYEETANLNTNLEGGGWVEIMEVWMIASTAWKVQALRVVCSRPNSVYVCSCMHAPAQRE